MKIKAHAMEKAREKKRKGATSGRERQKKTPEWLKAQLYIFDIRTDRIRQIVKM